MTVAGTQLQAQQMSETRYLVIGGHARGVGKTALVVDVIRAFPDVAWTAVKITPHGHGAWPEDAATAQAGSTAVLQEEEDHGGSTDSSRYLVAGAQRAFWLRVREERLAEGMALLKPVLKGAECVILESNAAVEIVQPALYLLVVDPAQPEFKESARSVGRRADAIVTRQSIPDRLWGEAADTVLRSKPLFEQRIGERLPGALLALIRLRLFPYMHPGTPSRHLPD